MIHEILPVGPLRRNCSVIGDEPTREAMVIDPGDDIEDILAIAGNIAALLRFHADQNRRGQIAAAS
jgi:glyoxylase-like metal-dependent hydrolase (beta-lactamase superfamily II)